MFALADVNSFYASCERVFRPDLKGKPIVVLRALLQIVGGDKLIRHCCKVSDEAAFCLIQRPYISKTLLT
ncbi:hypothetical protein, partial [Enterobacter hormaechei]|uniref:Y-family DNA polymerase n=1 Tax=Enterobacter hormaechei TaxID=158836 RepID=UPI001F15C0BF